MYCVCYICGNQYRNKPPFGNDLISHGLCGECFPVEMERIKKKLIVQKKGLDRGYSCQQDKNLSPLT